LPGRDGIRSFRKGTMKSNSLFETESLVAQRQPKTDRLILASFLREAAADNRLDEPILRYAHKMLVKWADLESSGRLARLKETQMQGDFLAQVFGEALGYAGPTDEADVWQRHQHYEIAGQTPDAILGQFRAAQPLEPLAVVELKGPRVHCNC
jgi:hypothetical protein